MGPLKFMIESGAYLVHFRCSNVTSKRFMRSIPRFPLPQDLLSSGTIIYFCGRLLGPPNDWGLSPFRFLPRISHQKRLIGQADGLSSIRMESRWTKAKLLL